MRVKIEPSVAKGRINAPPSKSMAHRFLISAAMCKGVSEIYGVSDCDDVRATLDCLLHMGVRSQMHGDTVRIFGTGMADSVPDGVLFAGESGSTLRFLIPPALLSGRTVMFSGKEGLMKRPMDVYEKLCQSKGMYFLSDGNTVTVKGPLKSGDFSVAGNISSQFISGLIFALPVLKGDSRIIITTPIESRSYIDMTLEAISLFGVNAYWENDNTLFIPGGQEYIPQNISVEGDWSGAAFPDALNLFGGEVEICGLRENTLQGDSVYKKCYAMLKRGVPTIHIGNCPDLAPILFSVAAAENGGVFDGTRRLKIKESDRASAMAEELKKFGTSVEVYEDRVIIYPASFHSPSSVLSSHNDHRIVMALSVLLTLVGGEIEGAEAVKKSYTSFFSDLKSLGIKVTEYEA